MKLSISLRFYGEPPVSFSGLAPFTPVSELQNRIELRMGIPIELQRISFLDKIDLVPRRSLQSYGISNRSRLTLQLVSEIDWKEIVLASRRSDLNVLKMHSIISQVALAADKHAGRPLAKASTSMSEFSPLKKFDKSEERSRIVERSWTRSIRDAKGDRQNVGAYTFWRAVKSGQEIQTVQQADLTTWKSYRLFVCALSAIACSNLTLLQILHDQDNSVFPRVRTKTSKRSILHIAACMGKEQGLKMILYRFDGMYEIMHDTDAKNQKAARLSRSIGERSCSQILLYYDWQRRNTIL